MEKLFLILLLNQPDQSIIVSRTENMDCFKAAEMVNHDPENRVVYQDELDNVMEHVAFCEYSNGTRIVVPIILRKGN